jgi:hypothetical protein
MSSKDLDEQQIQFLRRLHEHSGGEASAQASMYAIGESLGLPREAVENLAEGLMGCQLIEIRTLSGGIGWTAEGLEAMDALLGPERPEGKAAYRLGEAPVLDPAGDEAVQRAVAGLKGGIARMDLEFGQLSEAMADLKSIDAQLQSPRPKTAVIRACLQSLYELLQPVSEADTLRPVAELLGRKA